MFKKIAAIMAFAALFAYSAVNYPYPQRKLYGNGTINTTNSTADADLKARFKSFVNNFYVENDAKTQARIKFDEPEYTVSEGIGYAMIMMVYFSDATTSYQTHFDKLWAYYKARVNGNGVMHWKFRAFETNPTESNGATDAELDVALALAMARYQFGNTQYETDAKNLIAKIWSKEMNSDGMHRPGDNWDADKNPSYVSPAAFEIFKDLDNSANWSSALTKNYTFLRANQNATSGLPSNWANADGSPKECSYCGYTSQNYGQDAVRAPWRWAWSKAWFAHEDAETLLAKLGTWVSGKTPGDIKGPITLNGTMGTVANASYLGSLMCALTHKSDYQDKLDSYWASWATISGDTYFNSAMQVLTGLLVSGNMPNLKACAGTGCGTDMPPPGDYTGDYTQLDRLATAGSETEEERSYTVTGEPWFIHTNSEAHPVKGQANNSVTNQTFKYKDENDNCIEKDGGYRIVLEQNGEWAARILNYTLNQGTYIYDPQVGLGLSTKNNGKPTSEGGYDLRKCTGGFSYEYKGSAHRFKALNNNIADTVGSDHSKLIGEAKSVAANWTPVIIPPNELAQPTWVANTDKIPFNLADVRALDWQVEGETKNSGGTVTSPGHSPMTGSLAIRNVRCLGDMELPSAREISVCGEIITPIALPKVTFGNSLKAMQNSVYLQATKDASLKVFDLKGNMVRSLKFTQGSHTVQLSDLPRGLYIIKASNASWKQTITVPVK